MQVHRRVCGQERVDQLGFVRGKIVGNDVALASARLSIHDGAQELHEVGTGVPRRGLPDDRARARVQGGVEREGAVAVVLEAVTLRPAWRQRLDGVEAIERLNGRFSSMQKTAACCGGLR